MGVNESGDKPLHEQVEDLRRTTDRLEEMIKEGQPSVLAAFRTLIADYRGFAAGRRDFPQAAILGVAFAYLRPRVVLILGSVAAIAVAIGQVWLLSRQNDLVDQQNSLIREQGYALRAQTAALLLADLDPDKPSEAKLSLLNAFGDIGFDSLNLLAAAPKGNAGHVARSVLAKGIARFSVEQRSTLLRTFILANSHALFDPTWKAAFIDGSGSLSGAAFTALDRLPTGSTSGHEDVQRTERDPAELVLALISVNYDVADIPPTQALEIQALLGPMYTEYFGHFSASSLGIATDRATITEVSLPGFVFLDSQLSHICGMGQVHTSPASARSIGSVISRAIAVIAPSPEAANLRLGAVVAVAIANVCADNRPEVLKKLTSTIFFDGGPGMAPRADIDYVSPFEIQIVERAIR